jgi:exodeoxyribonuclease VII small subunit
MAEKVNFEKSLARLEEITKKLEKGNLTLDEMIKLYTEGTELAGECNKALEYAQLKISKLSEESEDEDEF